MSARLTREQLEQTEQGFADAVKAFREGCADLRATFAQFNGYADESTRFAKLRDEAFPELQRARARVESLRMKVLRALNREEPLP